MYIVDSKGNININAFIPFRKQPVTQLSEIKTTEHPVHPNEQPVEHHHKDTSKENFTHLHKRHSNCNCHHCWINFSLNIIYYAVLFYLLYLIVKFFTDNKKL